MKKVGTAVAQRARAFGFRLCFYDPHVADGVDKALGDIVRCGSLAELLQASDCVSLHASLTESSLGMMGEGAFRQMRPGAFLVNTAQAGLVDEFALAAALKEGRLKGAAVDVFDSQAFNPLNGKCVCVCVCLCLFWCIYALGCRKIKNFSLGLGYSFQISI